MLAVLLAATVVASAARAFEVWNAGVPIRIPHGLGLRGDLCLFPDGALRRRCARRGLADVPLRGATSGQPRRSLTTPISTRAIVVGKWLSLYRTVPWLAVGPGSDRTRLASRSACAAASAGSAPRSQSRNDRASACGVIVATILAHGAAIISVGLALATWLRRETRAIGVSITAFVLISVVWPTLCLVLTEPDRRMGHYRAIGAAASPINSVTAVVSELCEPDDWWASKMIEVAICTGGVAVAAMLILAATIATFDRQMGRMPERGRRPSRAMRPELEAPTRTPTPA